MARKELEAIDAQLAQLDVGSERIARIRLRYAEWKLGLDEVDTELAQLGAERSERASFPPPQGAVGREASRTAADAAPAEPSGAGGLESLDADMDAAVAAGESELPPPPDVEGETEERAFDADMDAAVAAGESELPPPPDVEATQDDDFQPVGTAELDEVPVEEEVPVDIEEVDDKDSAAAASSTPPPLPPRSSRRPSGRAAAPPEDAPAAAGAPRSRPGSVAKATPFPSPPPAGRGKAPLKPARAPSWPGGVAKATPFPSPPPAGQGLSRPPRHAPASPKPAPAPSWPGGVAKATPSPSPPPAGEGNGEADRDRRSNAEIAALLEQDLDPNEFSQTEASSSAPPAADVEAADDLGEIEIEDVEEIEELDLDEDIIIEEDT